MLTLSGQPYSTISKPIIGKISFSPVSRENRADTIYVNPEKKENNLSEYLGIITKYDSYHGSHDNQVPTVIRVKETDQLFNDDVVEIFKNGMINVLYQKNSNDNILFLTEVCNLNCQMCPQPFSGKDDNFLEKNLQLIPLIDKSTEELALTGGEPSLIGDEFFKIILACKHILPDTTLLILTNGIKFSDYEFTRFFTSLKHPKITLAVSLYADNAREHDKVVGKKGAFDDTIRGLVNLASFQHSIEIRVVIHKYTYDRLPRIAEYIYRNLTFTKHIAFMGLEPVGRAREYIDKLWIEPLHIIDPLRDAIYYLKQRDMNFSIYNLPLCLLPKNLWQFARKSISGWKNRYHVKCGTCEVNYRCSGLFESGLDIYGKFIKPI